MEKSAPHNGDYVIFLTYLIRIYNTKGLNITYSNPYSFFDKKLRLYKVVIKSILVELKKMILK